MVALNAPLAGPRAPEGGYSDDPCTRIGCQRPPKRCQKATPMLVDRNLDFEELSITLSNVGGHRRVGLRSFFLIPIPDPCWGALRSVFFELRLPWGAHGAKRDPPKVFQI